MMDSHMSSLNWRTVWKKYKGSHFYLILIFLDREYIKINFTGLFLFNKDFIVSKWPLKHPIHFNPTLFLGVIQFPFKCFHFQLILMYLTFWFTSVFTFKVATLFCQGASSYLRKHNFFLVLDICNIHSEACCLFFKYLLPYTTLLVTYF